MFYFKRFSISERYRNSGLFRSSRPQPEEIGTQDELPTEAKEDMFKCATNLAAGAELED